MENELLQEPLINVIDPDTQEVGSIPQSQAEDAMAQGYAHATSQQVDAYLKQQKFESTPEQIKTALEGAASAATFGGSTAIEKALGVDPADIRDRREINPGVHTLGQIGGLLIPGAPAAKVLSAAGKGAKALTGLGGEGATLLSKIGAGSVQGATESAIFQGGDEISKMLSQDPNTDPQEALQSAITNIGMAGLIGAPIGGGVSGLGALWESKVGNKLSQGIEDFNVRIKQHLENPNPVESLSSELKARYESDKSIFDEVYGPQGLKAEAIEKLMPNELSDKMVGQAQDFLQKANHFSLEMERNPDLYPRNLSARFNRDLRIFSDQLSQPGAPGEVFNALQEFKQRMQQEYGGQFVPKVDPSHDFIQGVRDLGSNIRTSLEDSSVWGKAADVQKDINKAFSQYAGGKQSPLKQFETKFTTNVNGERIIDPGKLQTYLNQTGKAGQKIKQEMLGNYIEASEAYRDAIHGTHSRMGVQNPLEPSSLHYAKSTLEDLSAGARLADALVNKGINRLTGQGIGASIGAGAGHFLGSAGFGALIGEHALGPFFSSILPSLVKPMLENPNSATGFKAAVNFGLNVIKGESLVNKAAKSIFKAGQDVLPSHLLPKEKETSKLDKVLKGYQENPQKLLEMDSSTGHYLPNHGTAMGQYAANAVNYLNSKRPGETQRAPLDPPAPPTKNQVHDFNRTLQIAEQPLVVLQYLKDGTLTSRDIQDLNALNSNLYQKLIQKMTDEMVDHLSKGEEIPHQTKLGLSLFMGQPLDSLSTPESIQSIQATFKTGPTPMQSMKIPQGSLEKISQMDMTNSQKAITH